MGIWKMLFTKKEVVEANPARATLPPSTCSVKKTAIIGVISPQPESIKTSASVIYSITLLTLRPTKSFLKMGIYIKILHRNRYKRKWLLTKKRKNNNH